MKTILYLYLTLVVISCNPKLTLKCNSQYRIFEKILNHYVSSTNSDIVLPMLLVNDRASLFSTNCITNYYDEIQLSESTKNNQVIKISSFIQNDSLIHIGIEHRLGAKGVFYNTKYNALSQQLDSIHFDFVIYE